MTNVLLGLSFIVGVLLTIFVVQNTDSVNVEFITFNTGRAPLAVVILISAAIGALLTFLLGLRGRVQHQLEHRRTQRRIRELEAQLANAEALGSSGDTTARMRTSTTPDSTATDEPTGPSARA